MGNPCGVPEPPPCKPPNAWVAPAQPLKHIPNFEWGSVCSWSLLCQRPAKSEVSGASNEALHKSNEDWIKDANEADAKSLRFELVAEIMLDLRVTPQVSSAEGIQEYAQNGCYNRRPAYPGICTIQLANNWQKCSHEHYIGSQKGKIMCCALHSSFPYHSAQRRHTVKLMVLLSCHLKRL